MVPYQSDHSFREKAFHWLRQFYTDMLPDVEVCIGETKNDELFNKAKAVNQAFRQSSGKYLVIADADVIFDPKIIDEAIAYLGEYAWVFPFKNVVELTKQETNNLISHPPSWPLEIQNPASVVDFTLSLAGRLIILTRAAFETVGGFDETFKGWGCEDDAFGLSLETLCGQKKKINSTIYHLYHEHIGENNPNFSRNLAYYYRYCHARGNRKMIEDLIRRRKMRQNL